MTTRGLFFPKLFNDSFPSCADSVMINNFSETKLLQQVITRITYITVSMK